MGVPTRITDFSTTAGSNYPTGSEAVGTSLDDYLRGYQAVIRLDLASLGSDIASATTTDLGAVGGLKHNITGTTTITGFGTVAAGVWKILKFAGALTLTHNATSLILPGGANITTAANDTAIVISEGSGNWRCVTYTKAASIAATLAGTETLTNKTFAVASNTLNMAPITNSLSADVALSSGASFFTGPTIAQGTSGTWFVSGTVTLVDTSSAANFNVKLWDGTTVIASCRTSSSAVSLLTTASLSGYIASPAGNLRISVQDVTSTSGAIISNNSGSGNDSTITAIRIA